MLPNGEIINERYRIDQVLGEGGMGIVYLGYDLMLERFVAIKEIKSSLQDYDKYIARLIKEAKVLAMLQHPNIVTVHDLIQYRNNWYIVMEYVEGMTLDKKLEHSGALPHEEAIPIFKQMLAALEYAHNAGVVHRDIKPGNVMITPAGQVKMMDFGLAKIQVSGSLTRSTKSEHTGGTLYYLSPEQVEEKPVDQRSDIYSLGMTCYEVLAGTTPVKEKKTTVAILNAILRDKFPLPTEFNASVPKELSKIIIKAVALKPGKRFQSAEEMLEAINDIPPPPRGIRFTLEILWKVALVLLVAVLILFTDWDVRLLETLGLSEPTTLTIMTEPEGAQVILNGKLIKAMTPLKKLRAQPDTNYVQIQMTDFEEINAAIVLQKGQDSICTFPLKPLARLAAVVKPSEAEILFDGKVTPLSELSQLALSVGEHSFLVALKGYKTIDTTLALAQGLNPIAFELEKITIKSAEGKIALTSEPSGAEVEIRGPMNFKKQTPVKNLKVPAGKYELWFRSEQYQDSVLVATVDSGRIFSQHVKLEPLPGLLKLTITPKSAVYIDQQLVHESTDYYEQKLAPGTYAVKIVHPATAAFWVETVNLAPGGEFSKTFDFSQEFKIGVAAVDSASLESISAEIYVDGVDFKKATPNEIVVRFGYHEIEVRAEGYESQKREFNVASTPKPLRFKLKRLP